MKHIDIKRIRKELKISQTELANRLECPQAYLSQIENYKRSATDNFIAKLSKVLAIEDIDKYIKEVPKKVIVHEDAPNDSLGIDIETSVPQPSPDMVERLVTIIERCHEMLKAKDEEIAHLRASLGAKYTEMAAAIMEKKKSAEVL